MLSKDDSTLNESDHSPARRDDNIYSAGTPKDSIIKAFDKAIKATE